MENKSPDRAKIGSKDLLRAANSEPWLAGCLRMRMRREGAATVEVFHRPWRWGEEPSGGEGGSRRVVS